MQAKLMPLFSPLRLFFVTVIYRGDATGKREINTVV